MYDAREKAIRDQQWRLNAACREAFAKGEIEGKIKGEIEGEIKGEIKGKIETIRILQGILQLPISLESEFAGRTLEELQQLTVDLQEQIRNRRSL